MSEPDVRTPRIAVWGFGLSLAGCVLGLGSFLGFAAMDSMLLGNVLVLPWGLLSIPGWVLSRRGLRVADKRHAPGGLANAGVILGIMGTFVLVLYVAWWALFLWAISHLE